MTEVVKPPEINVQGADDSEWVSVSYPPQNSSTEVTSQQMTLSEAGAQVEASANSGGNGTGDIDSGTTNKEDDFGDFQGADSGPPTAAAEPSGGSAQSNVQSTGNNTQEKDGRQEPASIVTESTANLQPQANSVTLTGMCTLCTLEHHTY